MRNCFPEVPPPSEEYTVRKVEDEYEEMTVMEVMNGKVSIPNEAFEPFVWLTMDLLQGQQPRFNNLGLRVRQHPRR